MDRDRTRDGRWPVEQLWRSAKLLEFYAPAIEAAGSLQTAVKLGIIQTSPENLSALARDIPQSRGGLANDPKIEAGWARYVDEVARNTGYDIETTRREIQRMIGSL